MPTVDKQDKLDQVFLKMALTVSELSKDPSTKVGSILTSPDNTQISCGYNGMVAGVEETDDMWNIREIKYLHVLHAEENNLLNCPFSTHGCTMYITHQPCSKCIIKLAQAKIKRIVYLNSYERLLNDEIWDKYTKMFDEVVQKDIIE